MVGQRYAHIVHTVDKAVGVALGSSEGIYEVGGVRRSSFDVTSEGDEAGDDDEEEHADLEDSKDVL